MKKSVFSLAILFSTFTCAEDSVTISGWVGGRITYRGVENGVNLENHASNIVIQSKESIGSDLTAFSYLRLKLKNKDFSGLYNEYAYVGLAKKGVGSLTIGKQRTNGFSAKTGDYTWLTGENNNITGGGSKVIKLRSDNLHGFTLGADYLFEDLKADNTGKRYGYGVYLGYNQKINNEMSAGIRTAYFYDKDRIKSTDPALRENRSKQSWRIATSFSYGKLSTALNYGETRYHADSGAKSKRTYVMISGKYKFDSHLATYAQYLRDTNSQTNARNQTYSIGTEYFFNKRAVVWAEYAHQNKSLVKNNHLLGAGLRVYF